MGEERLIIVADINNVVDYALYQNGIEIIRSVVLSNITDDDITDIDVYVQSSIKVFETYKKHVDIIPKQSKLELNDFQIVIDEDFLASLSEKVSGYISIACLKENEALCSTESNVTVLAFDEWHGCLLYPELLTAFVLPNHPEITKIIARAQDILGSWTGDPSMDEYQTKDPNRVLKQAAAIYGALQEKNIAYATSPASFEDIGQRIRLCDAVIQQKMGNCMDLSLLYAACLEAVGINSLLIMLRDHIFAGLWLEECTLSEPVQYDSATITKRLAAGIGEVAVVECTAFVAGKQFSFGEAQSAAERKLNGENPVRFIIDLKRARLSGITPLPKRIQNDEGWHIERESRNPNEITDAPDEVNNKIKLDEFTPIEREKAEIKKFQWERKLLDLGLRNALINLRPSGRTVPILTSSIDDLEDMLADGEDFTIEPRPGEWHVPVNELGFENMHDMGMFKSVIESEFANRRLRAGLNEGDLNRSLKGLYRAAKVSLEENGANTLYLALGILRWFETDKSTKARYAPIILIPVEIVRKYGGLKYNIRIREEDPQMNITILEKLKQDFGIIIDELNTLPLDEHGIDTRKVFTIIRQAVMSKPKWDVLESAYLGIFSFPQFMMWNDLQNRSEEIMSNKIVSSLLNGRLQWEADEMVIPNKVPESGVFIPLPTDASQLYAIEAAIKGNSFVLHGPPGTGKSQTITSLIANALSNNKTVLFIAEKMAALEVVQKRLNSLGLGPFCLELHSNKSNKKDVLEQLRIASEAAYIETRDDYGHRAVQTAELRDELERYVREIHSRRNSGYTLFELIDIYEDSCDTPDIPIEIPATASKDVIDSYSLWVDRLVSAGKTITQPYHHPLHRIRLDEYRQALRDEAKGMVQDYLDALQRLDKAHKGFYKSIGVNKEPPYTLLKSHVLIVEKLIAWLQYPKEWARQENLNDYLNSIRQLSEASRNYYESRAKLDRLWKEEFLQQNGKELLDEYNMLNSKWIFAKSMGLNKLSARLEFYKKMPVSNNELGEQFALLMRYQQAKDNHERLLQEYKLSIAEWWDGENTDWDNLESMIEGAIAADTSLKKTSGSDKIRKAFGGRKDIEPSLRELLSSYEDFKSKRCEIYAKLKISEIEEKESWIQDEMDSFKSILDHIDELREWITWVSISEEGTKKGLGGLVEAYSKGLEHDDVKRAFNKNYAKNHIMAIIDDSKVLSQFSGSNFNELIKQYRRLDDELSELSKEEIYNKLASNVPNFARMASQNSEVGILQRAIKSGGRGISIRKLFDSIPTLLPRLCPCMLMSPLSAAQYLDFKREPFDLVVFDEASQITTSKAIGAISRGKDAIIVGDPKQMPPTSFFSSQNLDEDNIEIEDLESILDDCLAVNMPETHLLWHYRSRNESLIAFSNQAFYENKLYTFPSHEDRESMVSLVRVDGIFERQSRKRYNRKEAECIVNELKKRCHDKRLRKRSVGIVTFNVSQQNLIDDLLSEACSEDEELTKWAYESNEPVFIKNLENVQGDERDVILFSIGYGKDESGKIYMNFGPLNREGGWRRLNVAVSRARMEMVVFSSLTPEQINLKQTSSKGVEALKRFIEYAAGKELIPDENVIFSKKTIHEEGIVDDICRHLYDHGYTCDKLIGHSAFQVDIGVVDKSDPSKYILGILLDGASYKGANTTHDRELGQIDVLKGLGWNITRIWCMDWWENKNKEVKNVLRILEDIEKNMDNETSWEIEDEDQISPSIEEKQDYSESKINDFSDNDEIKIASVVENDSRRNMQNNNIDNIYPEEAISPQKENIDNIENRIKKEYQEVELYGVLTSTDAFLNPANVVQIQRLVQKVIDAEAPICDTLLMRRVLQSVGIERAGSRLQRHFDTIFAQLGLKATINADRRTLWKSDAIPKNYKEFRVLTDGSSKRDVKEVPVEEAANAVCYILYEEISLTVSDLRKEAAKVMGYSRMGKNVVDLFDEAIHYSLKHKRIEFGNMENLKLTDEWANEIRDYYNETM